jgi:predicted PurR-regulated permease PerM
MKKDENTRNEHNRVITRTVVVVIAGVTAAWALFQIRDVLLTLYISGLLAIGLSPIVRRIEKRRLLQGRVRLPRWIAILSLYVGFLLAVGLLLALIIPPIANQMRELAQDLPGYAERVQKFLVDRDLVSPKWQWSSLFANMQVPGVALTGFFGALTGALGIFGKAVTILILPFYLLLESTSLRNGFLSLLHQDNRKRADRIMRAVTIKVGAWLGGQLLLAAIIGTTATVGFWLLGVPYFYVLGLIAAVGEMIPVIGPILAAVPAIGLAATVSPQTALFTALYCWAQQFFENNLLVPRIMERQVGVSPVTIMVALLVGSTLLGFLGAILAVPSAAIAQVLVEEYLNRDTNADE